MIAFVTDELPRPGAAGHLALNHAIITWLRTEGFAVTILLTGTRQARLVEPYPHAAVAGPHVAQAKTQVFVTSPRAVAKLLGRFLLNRLPYGAGSRLRRARHGADTVLGRFPSAAEMRWCAEAVARLQPAAVLIDTMFRAPLLAEPELAGRNSIIIAHDVFHRRAQALNAAGYKVQPEGLTRMREALLLSRAQAIAAIQPEEAALIRALCPSCQVFTAPMPALPCFPPPHTSRVPGRLVFVGSASLPNLDGLRWFLSEIWPLLAPKNVTLDIIGDCGTMLTRLPPGVKAWGRVVDMAPLLHRASLAIAPLRAGSGLKVKLLDYARHGLTTIVTPPGIAGFEPDPESPFIVAGSAAMFAQAVTQQLRRPAAPEQAIAYCTRHYGTDASFAGLRAALRPDDAAAKAGQLRELRL